MCSKTQSWAPAEGRAWRLSTPVAVTRIASPGRTSRSIARADLVERAGLRRHAPATLVEAAQHQRAHPVRVAERHQLAAGDRDDRVGPHQPRHHGADGGEEAAVLGRDHRGHDLGVGAGPQVHAGQLHLGAQLARVGEVAVVAERHDVLAAGVGHRLGVVPLVGAGGRVAHVPDRGVPGQAVEGGLVEDRAHQAEVALDGHPAVVAGGDAGALLAAVLQRVQRVVGQPGDVPAGRRGDAEDAALLLGGVVVDRAHASASGRPRS